MIRLGFLIPALLLSSLLSAQFYGRVGYCANYYNMRNYNAMVDRYNETRPWLNEKMDYLYLMHGLDIGVGVMGGFNGIEFYFRTSSGTVTASGSPNGGPVQTRHLKARDSYFGYEMHRRVAGPVALSLAGEISRFSTFTKVDDAEFTRTDKKMSFGLTPGIKVVLGRKAIKPMLSLYYTFPFIWENHSNAWATLDQNNYRSEPADHFRARAGHFGISLSLAFGNIAYD